MRLWRIIQNKIKQTNKQTNLSFGCHISDTEIPEKLNSTQWTAL